MESLPTMGYIGNPLDPWGAAEPGIAYGACFEAMAASGAYDVLVLVHDFPYKSMPAEVATASDVTTPLLAATRDRPAILPVYVSLTSGEHPPEIKALLDEQGAGARCCAGPWRRSARSRPWRAGRAGTRPEAGLAAGPWRATWPALGADRRSFGQDETAGRSATHPERPTRTLSERASLELLRDAGLSVTSAIRCRSRRGGGRGARDRAAGRAEARCRGARPQERPRAGPRSGWPTTTPSVPAAATDLLEAGRRHGLAALGLLVEPMAEPGLELIVGLHRDPQFGPAVVVGLGGIFTEVLDDVSIRLAPRHPRDRPRDAGRPARRARPGRTPGSAGDRPIGGRRPHRRVARLVAERDDVVEIDLNPVFATPVGAVAVDALVILEGDPDA